MRIIEPIQDRDRILALESRAAREAAILQLAEGGRRNMVCHFLIMAFAKQLCESLPHKTHEFVLARIPLHLVEQSKDLARSHIQAARIVARSSSANQHGHD